MAGKHTGDQSIPKLRAKVDSPPNGSAFYIMLWALSCITDFNGEDDHESDHPAVHNASLLQSELDCATNAFEAIDGSLQLVPDSGASKHCICTKALFTSFKKWHPNVFVRVANGQKVAVTAIGDALIQMVDQNGITRDVILHDCLYIPSFHTNLLSIKQLWKRNGIKTKFCDRDHFKLPDGSKLFFDESLKSQHVVALHTTHGLPNSILHKRYGHCGEKRLRMAATRALHDQRAKPGEYSKQQCDSCERGGMDRKKARPYKFHKKRSFHNKADGTTYTYFGEFVSSDLCDFSKHASSIHKYKYAVGFLDHATGIFAVEYIKSKQSDHVQEAFKRFIRKHKRYLHDSRNPNPGCVYQWHTDNGGEFISDNLDTFCDELSIKRSWSVPYSHNTNARVERMWGLILRPMRAMFADSRLPLTFWPEAMDCAVRLHNSLPSSSQEHNISPFERLTGMLPDLSKIRVFGCKVWYRLPARDVKSKLLPKSVEAINLGLDPFRPGYRVFVPSLRRFTTTDFKARFKEDEYVRVGSSIIGAHEHYDDLDGDTIDDKVTNRHADLRGGDKDITTDAPLVPNVPAQLRMHSPHDEPEHCSDPDCTKGKHSDLEPHSWQENLGRGVPRDPNREQRLRDERQMVQFIDDFNLPEWEHDSKYLWVLAGGWSKEPMAFKSDVEIFPEPKTYEEAIRGTYGIRWKESMDKEISDLLQHQTYDVVSRRSLPNGRKPTKGKWVYKVKYNRDGTIDRFKSRFVVCGYSQREGIDYDQAFSSTLRAASFRLLMALCAIKGYAVEHMDVTSAFTQALLDDVDIWVEPPKGYEEYERDGKTTKVLKLKRALYGTKQASRLWQNTLRDYLVSEGFACSLQDPCLYVRHTGKFTIMLGVYVDDLVVAHNDLEHFHGFRRNFERRFRSKHLGKLSWFLGMSVDQLADGSIELGHQKYIKDLVEKFYGNVHQSTPFYRTPVNDKSFSCIGNAEDDIERSKMVNKPYISLVGSLLYLSTMSRPDVSFHLSKLCKYMSDPNMACYDCAVHLLLYLLTTSKFRIRYSRDITVPDGLYNRTAEIKNNMGFVAFSDSSWNVPSPSFGYVLFLANGPISFASKTCKSADSSCEAEYTAAAAACRDINFIRILCTDLGFPLQGRLALAVDNTAAIDVAQNMGVTGRNKHYGREIHYFREEVHLRRVVGQWIPTKFQIGDIFTKNLDPTTFYRHRDKLLVGKEL